jgi:hypothetical protein
MRIDFTAYSGDCVVRGALEVTDGERLTDFVNRQSELAIEDAELTSFADGHVVPMRLVRVVSDDLYAIEAHEPRGETARRIHTVRHRLELRAGPYTILGQLHVPPGSQPLSAIGRRSPLVPLTNATIAWNDASGVQVRDLTTLIVNREMADWVRADPADLPAFAGVPVAASR